MEIDLKDFPKNSGIYIFKSNDEIIYIGSSKNIYQRMAKHNTEIKKGLNAKCNPALYQFLQTNPFTVEFHLIDNYREEEQELIDKYKPIYNAIRAYTGLGARKGIKADYAKEYRETYKEEVLEQKKQYDNQQCLYNGETLTLDALRMRFRRQGIEHPTIEAKKYLI